MWQNHQFILYGGSGYTSLLGLPTPIPAHIESLNPQLYILFMEVYNTKLIELTDTSHLVVLGQNPVNHIHNSKHFFFFLIALHLLTLVCNSYLVTTGQDDTLHCLSPNHRNLN